MTNGCICCTLRDDLLAEVRRLAAERRFDYLLIEGTGIAEPLPVASTFSFRDEAGAALSDVARLDTMVTVVDAVNLLKDYGSNDFLRQRGETAGAEDNRTLVDLLVEQIEFADVVVINKARDVAPETLDLVRSVVRGLNADARIIEASHGQVAPEAILDTGLFDEEKAQEHPLWFKELYGAHEHVPETEEYGIGSFVYRARRPFDPQTFQRFVNTTWPGLIRAKGHFWLATRPEWVGEFSLAGAVAHIGAMGFWWAAVPRQRWPEEEVFASASTRSGARSGATGARNSCSSAAGWTATRSRPRSMHASSARPRFGDSIPMPIATCPIPSRPGAARLPDPDGFHQPEGLACPFGRAGAGGGTGEIPAAPGVGAEEADALSVNEIACADPGCPDVETVVLVMRAGEPTRALRFRGPLDDLDEAAARVLAAEEVRLREA
ncbi:hypothetical protein GCM10025880_58100 [Methylorubrum aminovorans]|nr:hypothetical protein GCM10025880_58100 [Methylorubrum aminovorans]